MVTDERGVVGEPAADVAVHPAALVLQRARQVPVIERGVGLEATLQHAVYEPVVEVDASLVDGSGAFGEQPRPGEREAVGLEAAVADQVEVARPAMIVVVRLVAIVGALHVAWGRRKGVPDAGTAAVALPALDLIGGGGHAKGEIRPELAAVNRKHRSSQARQPVTPRRL